MNTVLTSLLADPRTLNISVTHGFSVLLHSHLKVFFSLHLHKCLSAGTPFSCVGEVDPTSIVENFAACKMMLHPKHLDFLVKITSLWHQAMA